MYSYCNVLTFQSNVMFSFSLEERERHQNSNRNYCKKCLNSHIFCATSPSAVGSTTHDGATMLELQQPCSSSSTIEQEQQEPTDAMETQQPCYSPTSIVPYLAARSNDLGE